MARKMAAGELQTTWFERHGSTPITEIPAEWPDDYKRLVERRIELIETDRNIGLIEQPEYKRRWNTEPWESQLERALREWLLDRLESYFDFDGRMNDEGKPTAKLDIALTSVSRLADVARQDADFMQVGEVYRDDRAFNVDRLVAELVEAESVPLLPDPALQAQRATQAGRVGTDLGTAAGRRQVMQARSRRRRTTKPTATPLTSPSRRSTPAPTSSRATTGGSAASWTCPRNAGSASRTAKARTARW